MQRKKIVYINGKFLAQQTSGVQRFAREIVYELDKRLCLRNDFQCVIVTPFALFELMDLKLVKIQVVKSRFGLHFWEQVNLPIFTFGSILLNLTGSAPVLKLKQICSIHDAAVVDSHHSYSVPYRAWYAFLNRVVSRTCLSIITVSEFSKERLTRIYNVKPCKISVVSNAADSIYRAVSNFDILKRFSLTDCKYILMVGSASSSKNIDFIRAAFRASGLKDRYKLVIVGDATAMAFKLQPKYFETLPSEIFTGRVDDSSLKALYENAFLFVFPSKYEGFGIPPLEAMACNCPVLSSNATSLPEVCGNAAEYFDPTDPNSFLLAFKKCEDERFRSELQARGLERITRYSWKDSAENVLRIVKCAL